MVKMVSLPPTVARLLSPPNYVSPSIPSSAGQYTSGPIQRQLGAHLAVCVLDTYLQFFSIIVRIGHRSELGCGRGGFGFGGEKAGDRRGSYGALEAVVRGRLQGMGGCAAGHGGALRRPLRPVQAVVRGHAGHP